MHRTVKELLANPFWVKLTERHFATCPSPPPPHIDKCGLQLFKLWRVPEDEVLNILKAFLYTFLHKCSNARFSKQPSTYWKGMLPCVRHLGFDPSIKAHAIGRNIVGQQPPNNNSKFLTALQSRSRFQIGPKYLMLNFPWFVQILGKANNHTKAYKTRVYWKTPA